MVVQLKGHVQISSFGRSLTLYSPVYPGCGMPTKCYGRVEGKKREKHKTYKELCQSEPLSFGIGILLGKKREKTLMAV